MTKKNTLAISAMYAVFFVVIFALSEFCHSDWCRVHDDDPLGWVFFIFLPLLPVFFLSLLTYRMRDEAFRAWWNPARFWMPVIIVATIITSIIDSQSGSSIGDFPISIPVLGFLYALFISSSLWKIVRTNRRLEK